MADNVLAAASPIAKTAPDAPPAPIACPQCADVGEPAFRLVAPNRYDRQCPLRIVTCRRCGFCYVNPQYAQAQFDHFYSHLYYEGIDPASVERREAQMLRAVERHYYRPLRKMLMDAPRDSLIEIGSGEGTWLRIALELLGDARPPRVVALDASEQALISLRRSLPSVETVTSTIEAYHPERRFGTAICMALIEHLTDPLAGLVAMNGMIDLGGSLIITTPSLDARAFRFGSDRFFKFTHCTYFTFASLAYMADKAGFEVLEEVYDYGSDVDILWSPSILTHFRKVRETSLDQLATLMGPNARDAELFDEAERIFAAASPDKGPARELMLKAMRGLYRLGIDPEPSLVASRRTRGDAPASTDRAYTSR